jgi:hypothetical protein
MGPTNLRRTPTPKKIGVMILELKTTNKIWVYSERIQWDTISRKRGGSMTRRDNGRISTQLRRGKRADVKMSSQTRRGDKGGSRKSRIKEIRDRVDLQIPKRTKASSNAFLRLYPSRQ